MKKKNPLIIVLIIVFVAVGLVQWWLQVVSRYYDFDGQVFQREFVEKDELGEEKNLVQYIYFDNGRMYLLLTDEYGVVRCFREIFEYSIHPWDNIGPIYFGTDSILSATSYKGDGHPITITTKCTQARGYNTYLFEYDGESHYLLDDPIFYTFDVKEEEGVEKTSTLIVKDDSIEFEGEIFIKVEKVNDVLLEFTRLYLDNEDIFAEYYMS